MTATCFVHMPGFRRDFVAGPRAFGVASWNVVVVEKLVRSDMAPRSANLVGLMVKSVFNDHC